MRNCRSRVIEITGGERGGKSVIVSRGEAVPWTMGFASLVWVVGPDYVQTHSEFEYIRDDLNKIGAVDGKKVSMPKDGQWSMFTETGCQVETKTSEDARKLASVAPDLAIMTEAAQQSYDVFLKLRGRIAEKRGLLLLVGTLEEGSQWYADLFNQFQGPNIFDAASYSVPSWANLGVYPGGFEDEEIQTLKKILPESLFLERHAAIPRKSSLLVFPEFDYTVHVQETFEYDHDLPVHLTIDPGYSGAYAINACHVQGRKVWSFDELYEQRPATGTLKMIEDIRQRAWWKDVETITIDVAGNAANLTDGRSVTEMWLQATKEDGLNGGRGVMPLGQKVGIQDGIDRYRTFLGNPKFPESSRLGYHPRCEHSIAEHNGYRYRKQRNSINRRDTELPVDSSNHAIKAMTYLLIRHYGYQDGPPPKTEIRANWLPRDPWAMALEDQIARLPPEFR